MTRLSVLWAQAKEIADNVLKILQAEYAAAKDYKPSAKDWLSSYWSGFMGPNQKARIRNTGRSPHPCCLL
jgi:hypothetical protein